MFPFVFRNSIQVMFYLLTFLSIYFLEMEQPSINYLHLQHLAKWPNDFYFYYLILEFLEMTSAFSLVYDITHVPSFFEFLRYPKQITIQHIYFLII